jgi:hypothetical protein
MAIFTNVPDTNLEPGDPIRSVDIIAIKENTVYNREHTILDILNSQTFTSSTTWTRPGGFDATDSVIAVVIGGGGSGGTEFATFSSGGGGGGVAIVSIPYGTVTSTVSVTIGGGGAAVFNTNNGNAGGTSAFGSYIRASGGRGGFGGLAATGVGGGPLINANSNISSIVNGGNGRTQDTTLPDGYTGGGGAFNSNNQFYIGVVSSYFGSGGNAATWSTGAATAGSAPGGGGGAGGSSTNASGAGARGEVRVYVVRGKVPANALLGTTSVSVAY